MLPSLAYPILCFVSFVLLCLAGLGASLHLVSRQKTHRVLLAFLISPAVALAEIGLILYPLFLGSIPVDRIELPFTMALFIFSLLLIAVDVRARPNDYKELVSKPSSRYLLGFIIVFLLLMLPASIGGDHSRYWQLNSYDATNYWSLSYFAQHIPVSQIYTPNALENAAQVNPALLVPMSSVGPRLVVELPLAWLCLLFNIPVYEFYYYFKLLSLAIGFFVMLAVSKRLKLPTVYQFGLAAVVSIGFWPWQVSDIDALSHLYSIPLGLLFLFAWIQLEEDEPLKLFSRQRLLFGIGFASLLGYYPEFVPLTLLGVALYYLKRMIDLPLRDNLRRIPGHLISIGIVIVLVSPTLSKMLHDLFDQSTFATLDVSNPWVPSFYNWLYTPEMLTKGLWGFIYYEDPSLIISLIITILGGALGIIVLFGVVKNVFNRKTPPRIELVTALFVSFWGGALIIYLFHRDWVAGKAFAMGAPFVMAALFIFAHQIISTQTIHKNVRSVVAVVLAIWGTTQFMIPAIRAVRLATNQPIADYYPLQSQIGDIVPVMNYLSKNPSEFLVSYFPDVSKAMSVGWEMMLSDQFRHNTLGGLTAYYDQAPIKYWQQIDKAPSQLLFDSSDNYLHTLGIGTLTPIANTPFQLYDVTPEELNESVFRSNFLNGDNETGFATAFLPLMTDTSEPYRSLGDEQGHIRFLAGSDTPIALFMSYKAASQGSISLDFNDAHLVNETAIDPNKIQYVGQCTTMRTGSNDLVLHYKSTADVAKSPLAISSFQVMPAAGMRVDVGSLNDGIDTSEGWYGREKLPGTGNNFRWAAQTANVTLFSCKHSDYVLRFSAFPLASGKTQGLTVSLNGKVVGSLTLENGLQEYAIQIPAALLNSSGLQSFTFQHTYAQVPANDSRSLAAFYDWIELDAQP